MDGERLHGEQAQDPSAGFQFYFSDLQNDNLHRLPSHGLFGSYVESGIMEMVNGNYAGPDSTDPLPFLICIHKALRTGSPGDAFLPYPPPPPSFDRNPNVPDSWLGFFGTLRKIISANDMMAKREVVFQQFIDDRSADSQSETDRYTVSQFTSANLAGVLLQRKY